MGEVNRKIIWQLILDSQYDKFNTPSLNNKTFTKSVRSLLNSFYQDYSFVTKDTDKTYRKKKFHFNGVCCKFRFIPSNHNYGGILSKKQSGIIRLSLVEPKAPTVALKFYLDNCKTEDLVMVPHQNEQESPLVFQGIQDTFSNIIYRTWFDVPIHRHNNINIIQAVTFPVFREVAKVFSIKFQHLFDIEKKS